MEKRQYLFLGAGLVLALMAITLITLQRREQRAAEQAALLPLRPIPAAPAQAVQPPPPEPEEPAGMDRQADLEPPEQPGEPEEEPAEEPATSASKLGPFLVVRSEDELAVSGPDGELLASADPESDARLAGKLGSLESLLLVEKTCDDPCNPRSRLFVGDGARAWPVLDAWGAVRLQDLDRDGTVEALLDHLMEGTQELVTLPYRLANGRFAPAYERFPDGVDRQAGNLAGAAESACEQGIGPECQGTMRALVGLELFRGAHPQALLGRLRLPPAARQYAEEASEEVLEELGTLAE